MYLVQKDGRLILADTNAYDVVHLHFVINAGLSIRIYFKHRCNRISQESTNAKTAIWIRKKEKPINIESGLVDSSPLDGF